MIFLDFETQSTVDLKDVGSKKYIEDSNTEMLSLVCKYDDYILVWLNSLTSPDYIINRHNFEHPLLTPIVRNNIEIVRSPTLPKSMLFMLNGNHELCAHNATFDKMCWEKFVSKEPVKWFDTLPCARAGGYPGELEKLSLLLTGYGKDEGSKAMKLLTNIKIKNGKKIRPVGTKVLWEQLVQYNIIDVLLLEMIYNIVKDYGEPDVIEVDRIINERGIHVDRNLIVQLYGLYTYNEVKSKSEWDVITGDLNPRSPLQIKEWLKSKGYRLPDDSLNKQKLEQFFNNPDDYENDEYLDNRESASIVEALRLRQNIVRAGRSKIERMAMLTQLDTDTITHQLVYYGAHTGRFSGRGLQPHNFARGRDVIDVEKLLVKARKTKLKLKDIIDAANKASKLAAEKGQMPVSVSEVLSTLTRSCIIPQRGYIFGICDYGQIEARAVAWLADETVLLKQFADDLDPYKHMAAKVFGIEATDVSKEQRQIGKIVILACGYGMSAGKFDANCRVIYNINLEGAGTSALDCVNSYRDTYKRIAGNPRTRQGIWQRYHDAAHNCIAGYGIQEVGPVKFQYDDNTLMIHLPSTRILYYRNCSVQDRVPGYCATLGLEPFVIPTIVYTHPHGYEGSLYGGLITENVAQAVARDILVKSGLISLERLGLYIPLHVHDEILSQLAHPKQLDLMGRTMSTPPKWAKGFPLLVEGYTCNYYTKSPFKKSLTCKYLNGKKA